MKDSVKSKISYGKLERKLKVAGIEKMEDNKWITKMQA